MGASDQDVNRVGNEDLTLIEIKRTPVAREVDLSAFEPLSLVSSSEATSADIKSISGAGCSFCAVYDTNAVTGNGRCWGCDGSTYEFSGRPMTGALGYGELTAPVGSTASNPSRPPFNYGPHVFAGCEARYPPTFDVTAGGLASASFSVAESPNTLTPQQVQQG